MHTPHIKCWHSLKYSWLTKKPTWNFLRIIIQHVRGTTGTFKFFVCILPSHTYNSIHFFFFNSWSFLPDLWDPNGPNDNNFIRVFDWNKSFVWARYGIMNRFWSTIKCWDVRMNCVFWTEPMVNEWRLFVISKSQNIYKM